MKRCKVDHFSLHSILDYSIVFYFVADCSYSIAFVTHRSLFVCLPYF